MPGGTNSSGGSSRNNGGHNSDAKTAVLPGLLVAFALIVTLIYSLS